MPKYEIEWTARFSTVLEATSEEEAYLFLRDIDPLDPPKETEYMSDSFDYDNAKLVGGLGMIPLSRRHAEEIIKAGLEFVKTGTPLEVLGVPLFLKLWFALCYYYPGAHPDDCSCWARKFQPLALEAWRLHSIHQIASSALYPVEAQRAGIAAFQQQQAL